MAVDETVEQVDVEPASPRRTLDERGVRGVSRVGGGARPSRCFVRVRERRRGRRSELGSVQAADSDGLRRDASEPGEDDFHVGGASARIRGVATCSCLEPRKPLQLAPELGGTALRPGEASVDGRLDAADRVVRACRQLRERGANRGESAEQRSIQRRPTQVRDIGVCGLRGRGRLGSLFGLAGGGRGPRAELLGLVGERAPPRVELEQHGLAGLAGEPQLTAIRVVPVAVLGDRRPARDVEQPVCVHEPDAVEQAEDVRRALRERPEAAGAGKRRLLVGRRGATENDRKAPETTRSGAVE